MSKLIEKLANSFSSKNLCPNVTTDYDPDEFTVQFSDGIYVYTFILYDELGFEEPDFDEYFEDEDEYDESEYWEEEDPVIYLNIDLEDYDASMQDIELDKNDFNIMFPIICKYMKEHNINYFRPY